MASNSDLPLIVVIGSLNRDKTLFVPSFDSKNEGGTTTSTEESEEGNGGKGANQATAVFRTSHQSKNDTKRVHVKMIGAVGDDDDGKAMKKMFTDDGLDMLKVEEAMGYKTGKATIIVDSSGDSRVILEKGANHSLKPKNFTSFESIGGKIGKGSARKAPDLIITQLEIPHQVVESVLKTAHEYGIDVLLNPAPPHSILTEIWKAVTHLVANIGEAAYMIGMLVEKLPAGEEGWQQVADKLHKRGVKYVVITLGGVGVFYSEKNSGYGERLPARKPRAGSVVDTTSAGDTFLGAYAARIVQMKGESGGIKLKEAVEFGLEAAAFACAKKGTNVSIPWGGQLGKGSIESYDG